MADRNAVERSFQVCSASRKASRSATCDASILPPASGSEYSCHAKARHIVSFVVVKKNQGQRDYKPQAACVPAAASSSLLLYHPPPLKGIVLLLWRVDYLYSVIAHWTGHSQQYLCHRACNTSSISQTSSFQRGERSSLSSNR